MPPGTPASGIGEVFCEIVDEADGYVEFSTNEKVALEVATSAAILREQIGVCRIDNTSCFREPQKESLEGKRKWVSLLIR